MHRIGIIGTGFGVCVLAPAVKLLKSNATVYGICGNDFEKTKKIASELGIPQVYSHDSELSSDSNIDVVFVAVPPSRQFEIVKRALTNKKHVFCEKPLTLSEEHSKELLSLARKNQCYHMVDFEFPELKTWKAAKDILNSGSLGKVLLGQLSWHVHTYASKNKTSSWKRSVQAGGGVIANFASHIFYNLEWLLDPIESICSVNDSSELEESSSFILRHKSGCHLSVSVATNCWFGIGFQLSLHAEKGSLFLENLSGKDYVDGYRLRAQFSDQHQESIDMAENVSESDGRMVAAASMLERFLAAIEKGQSQVIPNLGHGLRVDQLINAQRESYRYQKWVEVADQ